MKIKKIFLWLLILALLLLDFAALDDITTGNEPDYIAEYATLAVSSLLIIFLFWAIKKKKIKWS